MRRRKYKGRHVLKKSKNRKPLTRKDVLLRLREIHELIDPKYGTQLTADDVEIIDYNFALAQLYDRINTRGEVYAIGFEADVGGENYDEDETDQTTESPIRAIKAVHRPTLWDKLRRRKRK